MKTSKILMPGILALMFLTACQKEEPVVENVSIEFEKDKINVNGGMNTVECTVTAQGTWNITSSYDWISCNKQSVAGKETIQIKIATNTAYDTNHHEETDRAGFLVFTSNSVRKSIWISQQAYKEPTFKQGEYTCLCPGDTFQISSSYLMEFTSDKNWVHIAQNSLSKTTYNITFDRNNTFDPDTVRIQATDGRKTWNLKLTRLGSMEDCQGNVYGVTRIGNRYWLATNLRTTKYDSDSPLAGQSIPERDEEINVYSTTFTEEDYNPYYVANVDIWESVSSKLSSIHIGYVYNWQAAIGYYPSIPTDYYKSEIQGICPNGWHIATQEDWADAIFNCKEDRVEFYERGLYCAAMQCSSTPFFTNYVARYWCPDAINGNESFTTETLGGAFILGKTDLILYLSYGYPKGTGDYTQIHRQYMGTDMRHTLSVRAVCNQLAQ